MQNSITKINEIKNKNNFVIKKIKCRYRGLLQNLKKSKFTFILMSFDLIQEQLKSNK